MPSPELPVRLPATGDDRYIMLYCPTSVCRVNTFDHGEWGRCPACNEGGLKT